MNTLKEWETLQRKRFEVAIHLKWKAGAVNICLNFRATIKAAKKSLPSVRGKITPTSEFRIRLKQK